MITNYFKNPFTKTLNPNKIFYFLLPHRKMINWKHNCNLLLWNMCTLAYEKMRLEKVEYMCILRGYNVIIQKILESMGQNKRSHNLKAIQLKKDIERFQIIPSPPLQIYHGHPSFSSSASFPQLPQRRRWFIQSNGSNSHCIINVRSHRRLRTHQSNHRKKKEEKTETPFTGLFTVVVFLGFLPLHSVVFTFLGAKKRD